MDFRDIEIYSEALDIIQSNQHYFNNSALKDLAYLCGGPALRLAIDLTALPPCDNSDCLECDYEPWCVHKGIPSEERQARIDSFKQAQVRIMDGIDPVEDELIAMPSTDSVVLLGSETSQEMSQTIVKALKEAWSNYKEEVPDDNPEDK